MRQAIALYNITDHGIVIVHLKRSVPRLPPLSDLGFRICAGCKLPQVEEAAICLTRAQTVR